MLGVTPVREPNPVIAVNGIPCGRVGFRRISRSIVFDRFLLLSKESSKLIIRAGPFQENKKSM